jgi:hypothetical protein
MVTTVPVVELAGAKLAPAPAGKPVTVKATGAANPFVAETLIPSVTLPPRAALKLVLDGDRVKDADAATTRVTVVVAVIVADVPVTVSG